MRSSASRTPVRDRAGTDPPPPQNGQGSGHGLVPRVRVLRWILLGSTRLCYRRTVSGEESKSPSLQAQTQAFLREFFAKGEELVRELIEENDRLRTALAAEGKDPSPDRTGDLVARLMRQIEELEAEAAEIRKLAGVARRDANYRDRLDTLEREHYHLAAMYVAGSQFHCATTVEDVLRTITEILLNFVGIGQFTVFCVDEERQMLFPLMREGGDLDECAEISLSEDGPLAEVLASPGAWKSGRPTGAQPGVLMYLPLSSGTRLVGLARVESFLPQKHDFIENDFGLLELISEHAGIGIESAWIRAHAREVPMARRALEELVS